MGALKKFIKRITYLLIVSTFLFDSYFKLSQLPKEADNFRSKYQSLHGFVRKNTGYTIPYDTGDVSQYSSIIVGTFAAL